MSTLRHRLHSAGSATYQTLFGGSPSIVRQLAALGTLRALWHPSYGITLNGSDVAAWRDLVAGYVLAQATPGAQPTYNATGWNGNPCLVYAGAEYLLCSHADWNTFFGGDDTDCAMCFVHDAVGSGTQYLGGLYGSVYNDKIDVYPHSGVDYYFRRNLPIGKAASGKRHTLGRNIGTAGQIWINGVLGNSATLDTTAVTPLHFCHGCSYNTGSPANYATANEGVVALYSTVTDPAALAALITACGYAYD